MLKKLLAILMIFSLIISSSITLVSCGTDKFSTVEKAQYHVLSVGNGNATFIQVNNKAIVLDCGKGLSNEKNEIDLNEDDETNAVNLNFMTQYMKSVGIEEIEAIFISHVHSDHYNLIKSLSEIFKINNVVSPINQKAFDQKIKKSLDKDTNIVYDFKNTYNFLGITFKNLSYKSQKLMNETTNENDKSTVLQFKLSNKTFLFTGDAEAELAYDIAKNYKVNSVDFYLAPHHGSGNSGTVAFFQKYKIKPKYCVVSGTGIGGGFEEVSGNHEFPGDTTVKYLSKNCEESYITGYDNKLYESEYGDVFKNSQKSYKINIDKDIYTINPVNWTVVSKEVKLSLTFFFFFEFISLDTYLIN